MAQAVTDIVAQEYDLIFSIGHIFTRRALEVLDSTGNNVMPLLFTAVKWPVEQGIIRSLKKPGGNATGIMREGCLPLMGAYFVQSLQPMVSVKKFLFPILWVVKVAI